MHLSEVSNPRAVFSTVRYGQIRNKTIKCDYGIDCHQTGTMDGEITLKWFCERIEKFFVIAGGANYSEIDSMLEI